MAQILLIGALGLGSAGALSAEENEVSIHQSEVDRVIASPLSGNWALDQEDFLVTQKNQVSLFSKQKPSQNKIQEPSLSSFSDSHPESLNPNFKDCEISSFTYGSHFYLNSFSSPAFGTSDFNSVLFLETDSNSPAKKGSWNQNKSIVLTEVGCVLSAYLNTGKNFCASDEFFLSKVDFWFGRNFASSSGFYPGDRIGGAGSDFLSRGFRNGRIVLKINVDSAQDVKAEKRIGRFLESSWTKREENPAASLLAGRSPKIRWKWARILTGKKQPSFQKEK
ncbi:hypothetical protein JWG44_06065 [Leptospira sp. 201903071]|uniref:hypothetical protein n=1 Tax=Leptospira ainazelensis TaxID=2810034 RepID=UPI00196550DF|nr:hypothetical protein [Leptospira ainazelensis]MBM9499815.1 hypothetical protein [Leptospira ainazelensis]